MEIVGVLLIGVGLAMDAFAVSICKGLSMKKMDWKKSVIISGYFGLFQAVMPAIGYHLGKNFEMYIISIDHWITFLFLSIIGIGMIRESKKDNSENCNDKIDIKTMSILALATSLDALAVGITFAFLDISITKIVLIIGSITFAISLFGVKIGNIFGDKYGKNAQIFGGIILIFIGIKILLEHLQIIQF